jgi:hypothetical protein
MTISVIMLIVMENPVTKLLNLWPDRQSVYADAVDADPSLNMVAVHRWFQRGSVPAKYWSALISGAQRREINLTADDVVLAHSMQRDNAERGAA